MLTFRRIILKTEEQTLQSSWVTEDHSSVIEQCSAGRRMKEQSNTSSDNSGKDQKFWRTFYQSEYNAPMLDGPWSNHHHHLPEKNN